MSHSSPIVKKRVCIFLSASEIKNPIYAESVVKLGKQIAARHIGVVYGGTNIGLMGILANTVLELGGEVIGVITHELNQRNNTHQKLTELHVTSSLNERLLKEIELSDAFIVFPGGIGTMDEFFAIWALKKINGLAEKPIGILNVNQIFSSFIKGLKELQGEGFITQKELDMLVIEDSPDRLLDKLFM